MKLYNLYRKMTRYVNKIDRKHSIDYKTYHLVMLAYKAGYKAAWRERVE